MRLRVYLEMDFRYNISYLVPQSVETVKELALYKQKESSFKIYFKVQTHKLIF